MASVPLEEVEPPPAERLYSGRPVLAADASRFASALNHLAGWRLRRFSRSFFEVDDSAVLYGGSLAVPPPPQSASRVYRHLHHVSGHAAHLWVGFDVLSDDESTTTARVDVSLLDVTGATTHDVGIRFDRAEGSLPGRSSRLAAPIGTARLELPVLCSSGVRTQDDAASGGSPTGPRLLYVPSGALDTRCQVVLTARECRVLNLFVWEWPESEV